MRKALIIGIAVAVVAFAAGAEESFLPLPAVISGGQLGLQQWLDDKANVLPTQRESIRYGSNGSIVVTYHYSGSGFVILDAYVYGCSPRLCELLAYRSGIRVPRGQERPIHAEITKSQDELVVRARDGRVYLRVPLAKDR